MDAKKYYHERLQKTLGQQSTPAKLSLDENVTFIKQLCSRFETVFMVIDALDEASDVYALLEGLKSFRHEVGNIKFLLTSRQEVELERLITPIMSHRLALRDHMRSDIRSYLRADIRKRIAQGTLNIRRESLVEEITAAIEDKADGM